jgi:hypothetical protein
LFHHEQADNGKQDSEGQVDRDDFAKQDDACHGGQRRLGGVQGIDVDKARLLQGLGQGQKGGRVEEAGTEHHKQIGARRVEHGRRPEPNDREQAQADQTREANDGQDC